MASLTYLPYDVNPHLPDVTGEVDWQEIREAMDYASRWAHRVYSVIAPKLGREKAGETADKVYARLLRKATDGSFTN